MTVVLDILDDLLASAETDIEFIRELISMQKFPRTPRRWDDLEFFSEVDHGVELRALARALTIREILDFYVVGKFSDLSYNDQHFFCAMYLKGRSAGIHEAGQKFFNAMNGVSGDRASLEYLRRMGKGWGQDVNSELSAPKAVRIVIEE